MRGSVVQPKRQLNGHPPDMPSATCCCTCRRMPSVVSSLLRQGNCSGQTVRLGEQGSLAAWINTFARYGAPVLQTQPAVLHPPFADHIIGLAKPKMERSGVVDTKTGNSDISDIRTSSVRAGTEWLGLGAHLTQLAPAACVCWGPCWAACRPSWCRSQRAGMWRTAEV